MLRAAAVLVLTLPCLAAALTSARANADRAPESRPDDAGAPAPALPACIAVTTEARYVPYGYNHIVILKNGCSKAALCSVATDVNPQPSSAEVPPGGTVEVQTFNASPSQTFVARVSCALH
jgi:hypothetical protein